MLKNIKLKVKKTGRTLCNLKLGKGFLGMTPKVQTIREEADKLYFNKLRTSALQKLLLGE